MYYLYILQSENDQTFYVGYTSDLGVRLKQHNAGKVRYTKGHVPYKVVYTEEYRTEKEAKEREKHIKRYGNTKSFLKSRFPRA